MKKAAEILGTQPTPVSAKPSTSMTCSKCGKPRPTFAIAKRKIVVGSCKHCEEIEERKRREQEKQAAFQRNRNLSGLRKRHWQMTFEGWKGKRFPSLENYDVAAGVNVYIHGVVGTGKTWAAAALAQKLLSGGHEVLFVNAVELKDAIGESFRPNSSVDGKTLMDRYSDIEVLIIDDLGKEGGQSAWWIPTKIYNILNRRYENMLPTIITSNFSLDELAKVYGEAMGKPIADRIAGHGSIVIELKGRSRRF